MKESCRCGAEDCPKCYPQPKKSRPEPDAPIKKPYRWQDKENEWMDYIHEGYSEPKGL